MLFSLKGTQNGSYKMAAEGTERNRLGLWTESLSVDINVVSPEKLTKYLVNQCLLNFFVIFCFLPIIIHSNPCSVGDWIHKKTNFSSLSQVSGLRKKGKEFFWPDSPQWFTSDSSFSKNSSNIFGKKKENHTRTPIPLTCLCLLKMNQALEDG